MCGIAGCFETRLMRPPDLESLVRMAKALSHRGPDDQGIQCGEHWGLASRRLSIIGVETGHQPLSNEDGTLWVAFNGEIYNHRALREKLVDAGHVFSSASDTEVLVHLYEEHGDALVDHLLGMFAFAIVDAPRRRLTLGRDRLGQKPLVYTISPEGSLIFASELAALQACPAVSSALDPQALWDYLSLGYIPAPRTIFRGVAKLPPACVLTVSFQDQEAKLRRYWRPRFGPKEDMSFRDAATHTRSLMEAAVRRRLESEVPLGAFLSGGIDSAVVVALMQGSLKDPVQTFTIGFEEERYDERAHAEQAARDMGTNHASQLAQPRDIDLLRQVIRHCGEPFSDSSILPTALLSRFARSGVTVALSGDGGDELFGGYERYRVMALHRAISWIPLAGRRAFCDGLLAVLPRNRTQRTALATVRRLLLALRGHPLETYMGFQGIFSREARESLCAEELGEAPCDDRLEAWKEILQQGTATDVVERFMELDMLEYLPGDLLAKVDTASMMSSLEVRCPFLDHELVDFVTRLPRAYKVGLRSRKRLLIAAAADLVPPDIASRAKRGFGVPIAEWLRGELSDTVREMVLWQHDWDPDGFFDNTELRRIAEEHLNGYRDHSFQLWTVFCFRLWVDEVYRHLR